MPHRSDDLPLMIFGGDVFLIISGEVILWGILVCSSDVNSIYPLLLLGAASLCRVGSATSCVGYSSVGK